MTMERVKTWLNQFLTEQEKILGLLILRHLVFRTNDQLVSSLRQALRRAGKYFLPSDLNPEVANWKDVIEGRVDSIEMIYGPPTHDYTPPGKSGELIVRVLTSKLGIKKGQLQYPVQITNLTPKERYLLVDDGVYTGDQLSDFISQRGGFLADGDQSGIVVALAHETAINKFSEKFPKLPIFYGEMLTKSDGFSALSRVWVDSGVWPYTDISPEDLYMKIYERHEPFEKNSPLGYGNLGLLVAYEHGIPDDSVELLWGVSATWTPLIGR
uniref:phosphoribosyltransferase-like protein n=1 Tax=Dechloromonas agitata TaxID=73030 RepID=UPI0018E054A4|nr:hypothetical protein [Dechloromonas agitata]